MHLKSKFEVLEAVSTMACLRSTKSASPSVFCKNGQATHGPWAIEIHVVPSNIPDASIGKKILLAYLIFGCCFALAFYLFRRWQGRSDRLKPRRHSYADQLTNRFKRNWKRDQALQNTSKTKSTRSAKR